MIIKALLIGAAVTISYWLLREPRRPGRLAATRLAGIAFLAAWIVAVLFPNVTTWLAQLVGVGRGTDLLLYALVVAFFFSAIAGQSRVRDLEGKVARLTRAQALLEHQVHARSPTVDGLPSSRQPSHDLG